ncbi:pyridoxamine 5'-phosphate oxidase [Actinobacillus equuli]|nr:pyridoxamine 5'-phosphate oxidase [Actinobacillus equuli]
MDLHNIREDYSKQELSQAHCHADPIQQFEQWLQEAIAAKVNEPTAMNVATVLDGKPTSRIVLLKEVNPNGFVFLPIIKAVRGKRLSKILMPH